MTYVWYTCAREQFFRYGFSLVDVANRRSANDRSTIITIDSTAIYTDIHPIFIPRKKTVSFFKSVYFNFQRAGNTLSTDFRLSPLAREHLPLYVSYFVSYISESSPLILALTLRIDREFSVAVAVGEHTRGIKLPQGAFSVLLRRAREDLVVVGEAQQTHHFRERQIGTAIAHRGETHTKAKDKLKCKQPRYAYQLAPHLTVKQCSTRSHRFVHT